MMHLCYTAHDWNESQPEKMIQFEEGIFADWDEILNYSWSFSKGTNYIGNFVKEVAEKNVLVRFYKMPTDTENVEQKRQKFFELVESSVLAGQFGKLWFNDYYLNCLFVGTNNSSYRKKSCIHTEYKIVCADQYWHKDKVENIQADDLSSLETANFPTDFPFDLGLDENRVIENCSISSSDFEITIWGPCSNPKITISNHVYGLNGSIADGERVVVKSYLNKGIRTIRKYGSDGSEVNWFGHRLKESSIFEPIPKGNFTINRNGSYGIQLILIENRSEPTFPVILDAMVEDIVDEPVQEEDPEDLTNVLLDFNSEAILDSNNEYIYV